MKLLVIDSGGELIHAGLALILKKHEVSIKRLGRLSISDYTVVEFREEEDLSAFIISHDPKELHDETLEFVMDNYTLAHLFVSKFDSENTFVYTVVEEEDFPKTVHGQWWRTSEGTVVFREDKIEWDAVSDNALNLYKSGISGNH